MDKHQNLISKIIADEAFSEEPEGAPTKGDIINFHYLANFVGKRTGTPKLGILKLDVDNLGKLFRGGALGTKKPLSHKFQVFFERKVLELWNQSFQSLQPNSTTSKYAAVSIPFNQNLYVVFSGGDDCFIIGAWDAIFEFTILFKNEFDKFMKKEIIDAKLVNAPITFSASLSIVDAKFPVVRFAKIADLALNDAKYSSTKKNRISIFGQVLTWEEFTKVVKVTKQLEELIKNHNEPRGILGKIKRSYIGFEKAQNTVQEDGKIRPAAWRLHYYLRNVKNKNKMEGIIDEYSTALLEAAWKGKITSPAVFPIAARWAEFLTRKSKTI